MDDYESLQENIIVPQINLGIIFMDRNNQILSVNKEFEIISGYDSDSINGKKRWEDFFPYCNIKELCNSCHQSGFGSFSKKFWCSLTASSNKKKIISATISYHDESSTYIITIYDLTEQFTLKNLLTEGGVLFSELTKKFQGGNSDGILVHDTKGNILFANPFLFEISGYSYGEFIGKNIREFFKDKPADLWLKTIQKNPGTLAPITEIQLLSKDKKVHHVLAYPRVLFDILNKPLGGLLICSDITELRNSEKNLRLSDEKYSKAFHSSPAPSSISTIKDGRYIEINESYTRMLGYDEEDLIGRYSHEINLFPDENERVQLINTLMKKGKVRNYEIKMFSKIKGTRTFSASADIIELQNEPCMIWVGYDITNQRRLEREILNITQRERYKIGQALHDDLGQHLVGVEGLCLMLKKRLLAKNCSEAEIAGEIKTLIREATEKSRSIARGLCPVRLQRNGLSSAITDYVSDLTKRSDVNFTFEKKTGVIIYNSHVAINMFYILREAINNSVTNGNAQDVEITYESDENSIYLKIKDNGCGFDIRKIHNKGMGLNLMYYRANAIGAHIRIESALGKGTNVILILPMINNRETEWDWKQNELHDSIYHLETKEL